MSDYNDGILPEPCLRMDTHFGDEYESIEFGDGTGYIKAAPILAKVGALHEEIDRLRDESADLRRELELDEPLFETLNAANDALLAENAELRKERDFYFQQVTDNGERAHRAIDALNAENAKLMELCMDMYEDIVCGCAECFFPEYYKHRGKPSECDNSGCGYRQIADRMRELGVDV